MGLLMSLAPAAALLTVEFTDVGMSTFTKAAMSTGMSNFIFIVYYNALASLVLLPLVVFRRTGNPITPSLLFRFFLIGFFGSLGQVLSVTALQYSSPTLISAMANLISIFTFVLSLLFRMEKIEIRSTKGVAICLGALISILGAFTITLYKGPPILNFSSSSSSLHNLHLQQDSDWVFGGFLMGVACLFIAIYYIITVATLKVFPEKFTIVFYNSFFSTILCGILALILERNPNTWKFTSPIQIIATLWAVFAIVWRNCIHTWCFHIKGPIYVIMFRPLGISIAVFMGILFLAETLYAGSIIGAIIVTLGFYTVMWGKWKEHNDTLNHGYGDGVESNSEKKPLLHCDIKDQV